MKVLVEADASGGMSGGGVLIDERSVPFVETGGSGGVGVREEVVVGVGSVVAGGWFERVGERS